MFHWLFHLDVYSSQQVDSVIPPNLKTAQQVGIALNCRNFNKDVPPPPVWMELVFFSSVNHVLPPAIFGWKPPPALVSPPALVPLPPALVPLPLGLEPCVGVFLEGRIYGICSEKKYPRIALCLFNKWGWTHHFYVRQKKSYIQWSNWEATFTPPNQWLTYNGLFCFLFH